MTSGEYFFKNKDSAEIIKIQIMEKKKMGEKLIENLGQALENAFVKILQSLRSQV